MAQHEHSPLQIISVNPSKDYVIAKFESQGGRWSNEHIGLSTLNGRSIETRIEQEGRFSDRWQVQFTVDRSLTRPTVPRQETLTSTRLLQKRITTMMLEHIKHLPTDAVLVASAVESDGGGRGRTAIYRRYGFKPDPDSAMGELETLVSIGEFIKRATGRADALEVGRAPKGGHGKPCGESHIPKTHKCSKKAAFSTSHTLRTAAKIALTAGVIAGGVAIARKFMSKDEWENSPHNTRKNPKLSPEEAQRIADEAIAGGQKWDVQEEINARRRTERNAECGGGLGKILAPAKFDAESTDWYALSTGAAHAKAKQGPAHQAPGNRPTKPRCQAGEGAFGTYFVHNSQNYGIKVFQNGDADDVQWEFDRLDKAHYAGVNVPQPLAMNATKTPDGEIRSQTLILSHMKEYKTLSREYHSAGGNAENAPLIVQRKIAREFRKLHTAGLAHGDIHNGNIMVHPRSKKVALVDFGYATELDDRYQPHNSRTGVDNLLYDMRRLPEFLGFSNRGQDFLDRYKGVLENVEEQANYSLNHYDRDGKFELAVKRYHDALETELLWEDRLPRSRFVSGADQPRIPGLTRRILTANANTVQREMLEFAGARNLTAFQQGAKNLGVKPARLFHALKPERDARLAKQRNQPFGTPLA